MAVRDILRMGDPRLLQVARKVERFNTPELRTLIEDMFDTMAHANGAGLAAPQIGVDLQVVIFGFDRNPRYPDAPTVPKTVLINPEPARSSPSLCRNRLTCRSIARSCVS